MTQVIKASSAGDFLALIPSMLGYRPSESILFVPFKDNRTMGLMRLDLPAPGEDEDTIARESVKIVARIPDTEAVAAVIYTERPASEIVGTLTLLGEHLSARGMRVHDLLFVAGDGYGSVNEAGMPLRPVSELAAHLDAPTYAESVLSGTGSVVPDDILMDVVASIKTLDVEDFDLVEFIENVIVIGQPDRLAPSDLAFAGLIMSRPALRDIMISQASGDRAAGERALAAQLAWEQGVEFPREIAMGMWGDGPQPNPKRLEAILELARYTAAIFGDAGDYSLAAWCSWALGKSTHADHYAKEGLKQDAEHGLCGIIISFVNAGHLPAWAFMSRRG